MAESERNQKMKEMLKEFTKKKGKVFKEQMASKHAANSSVLISNSMLHGGDETMRSNGLNVSKPSIIVTIEDDINKINYELEDEKKIC